MKSVILVVLACAILSGIITAGLQVVVLEYLVEDCAKKGGILLVDRVCRTKELICHD